MIRGFSDLGFLKVLTLQQENPLVKVYFFKECFLPPGSIANKVFHEVLMDTCTDLTSHCWPQDSGKKRKKDGLKSSQTEGKRSKPQRKETPEVSNFFHNPS